jgi:hypothetical protein
MPDTERLLKAIDAAEQTAYGSETDSQLSEDRALAIRLFNGEDINPPAPGRSSVVDRSVFETVHWVLPSLIRIFASGDDIVEFEPVGPEDEEAAKQESQYLNYKITQKTPWFNICQEWFTDALVTKNAYCWAYMDKRVDVSVERYDNQTLEGLTLMTQDPDVKIVGAEQTPEGLINVEIRRSQTKPQLSLCVLPPERVKVSELTPSWSLRDCDYFEYWDYKPISTLRAQGYKIEDSVADGSVADTLEDDARDVYLESDRDSAGGTDIDPSMRRVRVRYIWIRHDYDEDGIAELQYVLRVGQQILERAEVSRIPVSSLVPLVLPHRHVGMSLADITADIQQIKTDILRQALDNLRYANNPAIAFNKNTVNLDDVLTSRPGQRIRVDGSPQSEFMPINTPSIFPQAMEALGFMEQVQEGRTGVNRYFQGTDQNALNKTATGIQQLSTMAAQRVEQIARIFASGIEELFSICHELILKGGHQAETVRLRGQWVDVDPSTWRTRKDMKISVGFASGNKDAMMNRLMMIADMQKQAMMGGLPIVKPENVYQTAIEITKAADFSAPDRFWTDPATVEPPPPPQPDATVIAAEQIKSQTALQTTQIKAETDLTINREKLRVEAAKAISAAELEDQKANNAIAIEHMKVQGAAELEKHRAELNPKVIETRQKTATTAGLEQFMTRFLESQAQQTEDFKQMLMQALQTMNAPRELVRDPKTGRAIGSRVSNG